MTIPTTHLYRRRALHQGEPMRFVERHVVLHRAGVRVVQTVAWGALALFGLMCIGVALAFVWGVAQVFLMMLRLLLGLVR